MPVVFARRPSPPGHRRGIARRLPVAAAAAAFTTALAAAVGPAAAARPAAGHPRLLFSAPELPALREKVRDGGTDDAAYAAIRATVDTLYATTSVPDLLDLTFGINITPYIGLAAHLETPPDTAAIALGRRVTLFLVRNDAPDDNVFFSPLRMRSIAFGYDMFFDAAPDSERTEVRNAIVAYIDTALTVFHYRRWLHSPYLSNISAMIGSALGLAAISVDGEVDGDLVARAIERADAYVRAWCAGLVDPDGAYAEGAMYAGWSMRNLVYYFWARKRWDGFDGSREPGIREMEKWIAYSVLPIGDAAVNNINDAAYLNLPWSRHFSYLEWAQSEWNASLSPWIWERLAGAPYGHDAGIFADKAATVLWHRDGPTSSPGDVLPRQFLWAHRGLYYYRSGWPDGKTSDDVVFSFYSGKFFGGHAQEDQNNFTLYGYGAAFAVDHGFGSTSKESEAHNMVFIDGKGQHHAGGSTGTDGDMREYVLSDFADYLLGDATAAYTTYSEFNRPGVPFPDDDWSAGYDGGNPVAYAHRRVIVVHDPGTPPYFLILDDIQKDDTTRVYAWRMHTRDDNTVDLPGGPVRIRHGAATLDLHVLDPPAGRVTRTVTPFDNGDVDPNSMLISLAVQDTIGRFTILMVPGGASTVRPRVTREAFPWGVAARLEWPDGTTDVLIDNRSGATVSYTLTPSDGAAVPVGTDARVALLRTRRGRLDRYLLGHATRLTFDGTPHVRIGDGAASCARTGDTVTIDRAGARFRFFGPEIRRVRSRGRPVAFEFDGTFAAAPDGSAPPAPPAPEILNVRAAPNPFNPTVTIVLDVRTRAPVTVAVFDVRGRLVRTVWNGPLPPGRQRLSWDGRAASGGEASSGVYFVRARSPHGTKTIKVLRLK